MSLMEFEVLGPIRVRRDAGDRALTGALQRTLLGLLLTRANHPVSVDALIDGLWGGERDDRALRRLHVHVHRLRQTLGEPDRLTFEAGSYRLEVLPGELDADRFERLVDEAVVVAPADPARCIDVLDDALALWNGPPYDGLDVLELTHEAARLEDRRLDALEALHSARLACRGHAAVVPDLTELVRRHPLRERFHALLMTSLYLGGRQADALRVFRDVRRTLVDELGLEPGPELRELERRILAGEPVEPGATPSVRPADVPAQLPADAPGFVGRVDELAVLDAARETTSLSVVVGSAGVGKTALAVHWAHRVSDGFADGQLYVDLRGYGTEGPVSGHDAAANLLRSLGVDGVAIPEALAERSAMLRSMLDGRSTLVVLDNASSADQVRPLLPGAGACRVVVTSRDRLTGLVAREGAQRIELDRMTVPEAERLLCGLLGDRYETERADATRLIDACARLPLALRVAAERIRAGRGHPIADLLAELADERARLDLLDAGGDAQTSVRAVFSWSYHHLDADAALAFRRLARYPGYDVDIHGAAALVGAPDLRTARRAIDALSDAHLVEETGVGRYQVHDLLRAYARELADLTDLPTDRDDALRRLCDYYLATAATASAVVAPQGIERAPNCGSPPTTMPTLLDYDRALRWLDAERSNLVQAAASDVGAVASTFTVDLSVVLWRYLDVGGYLDDAERLHARAISFAADGGDRLGEAIARRNLGLVAHRRDRPDDALGRLSAAVAVFDELGARESQAIALNCLASLHHTTGRVDEAMSCMTRSLDLLREIGHRPKLTIPLHNLGFFHLHQARHDEAFAYLEASLAIAEEHDDRTVMVHALRSLAQLCLEVEHYDQALAHAHRVVALARESRVNKVHGGALNILGSVYRRLGRHEEALHHHRVALELARLGGAVEPVAGSMNALAATYAAAGHWAQAQQHFEGAAAATERREVPYEHARARAGMGDAQHALGDDERAAEHWRAALATFRELGSPEADEVETRLAGLAAAGEVITAAPRIRPG